MLVGNPVHVYTLIQRLTTSLGQLRLEMSNVPEVAGIERGITQILRHGEYPDGQDMEGVTQSVSRVMFTYKLDPLDLANGKIYGKQTEARLSPVDMFNIAIRHNSGQYPLRPGLSREFAVSIEWAEAALAAAEASTDQNKHLIDAINNFLDQVRADHDKYWQAPGSNPGNLPNEEYFLRKIRDEATAASGRQLREEESDLDDNLDISKPGYYIREYNALCRGEQVKRNGSRKRQNICLLVSNNDAYYILAPFKMEIVSSDPVLFMFHDVLTEKEMEVMKTRVASQLSVGEIQDTSVVTGGGAKVTNERTQSNAWIWDHMEPIMHKLSLKTGVMSGLITAKKVLELIPGQSIPVVESEAWQIGIYGPGGHYLPHYDSFEIPDPTSSTHTGLWVGNRIATVMFYLSHVLGGSTAFPQLGLATRATRGSAVFWFNLDHDGSRDDLSLHGACPTALGIKWVSNKWIREGAQIWTRPCHVPRDSETREQKFCDTAMCDIAANVTSNKHL